METITINNIGIYDNSKALNEQTEEVQEYINELMVSPDSKLEVPLNIGGNPHPFLKASVSYLNSAHKLIQNNSYSPAFGHPEFASKNDVSYTLENIS